MRIQIGKCYEDGNGNVHGPMKAHPSQPHHFAIAIGATYSWDGRHVMSHLTPGPSKLNLVHEVKIEKMPS